MKFARIPGEEIINTREAAPMRPFQNGVNETKAVALFRLRKGGAGGAFLVQVGGACLGLTVHIIVARLAGVNEYGVYTLVLTWVSVLSVLALLGLKSAVVRFVPTYTLRVQWSKLRAARTGVQASLYLPRAERFYSSKHSFELTHGQVIGQIVLGK